MVSGYACRREDILMSRDHVFVAMNVAAIDVDR